MRIVTHSNGSTRTNEPVLVSSCSVCGDNPPSPIGSCISDIPSPGHARSKPSDCSDIIESSFFSIYSVACRRNQKVPFEPYNRPSIILFHSGTGRVGYGRTRGNMSVCLSIYLSILSFVVGILLPFPPFSFLRHRYRHRSSNNNNISFHCTGRIDHVVFNILTYIYI